MAFTRVKFFYTIYMSRYYIRDDSVGKRVGTCPVVMNNFICRVILSGHQSIKNVKFSQYLSDDI